MADKLIFELVSPSALLASEEVDMVVVPGADGDFGVLAGHAPVLSNLRAGVVDIHNDGQVTKSLFVEGGFAEAADGRCTLLATKAQDVADISAGDASARLTKAQEVEGAADENGKAAAAQEVTVAKAMVFATSKRAT